MGDAGRFAIGIAVVVGAMIAFFFAFHPGGVVGADNPLDAFLWLFTQFNSAGQESNAATQAGQATSQGVGGSTPAAPTGTGA